MEHFKEVVLPEREDGDPHAARIPNFRVLGKEISTARVIELLNHLNNSERLEVIEAATRLTRENLVSDDAKRRAERAARMRAAAEQVKESYAPGGELTEWTTLDTEDFLDDTSPR